MGRQIFEIPRAAEYFSINELQAQTGQPKENFAAVVLKELVDNALDACENNRIPPEITIQIVGEGNVSISVSDNGSGIAPETVEHILNFSTRTSDKVAYRSPSRGAQGNAWKTIIGIPVALGCKTPTIIESQKIQHIIRPRPDPVGNVTIDHNKKDNGCQETQVIVTLPGENQYLKPRRWGRSFALFNPHAVIKISSFGNFYKQAHENDKTHEIYHRTVSFPMDWRKFLPDDPTSIYWYSLDELKRLIFLYIGASRNGGRDLPLRDFVREFRQLSGSARAKAVCDQLPTISRLSDFASQEEMIVNLFNVMRRHSTPPSPQVLGKVGEDHLLRCFRGWHGVRRHWYKHIADQVDGIPFVFEFLVAETERPGEFYHGVNFSPTYSDPLSGNPLSSPKFNVDSLWGFLNDGHASPRQFDDGAPMIAAAMHLICPSLVYLDRGKTRLKLPEEMLERISSVLWRAIKPLYKEGEARRKDAARAKRTILNRLNKNKYTHKEVVFHVLPEAISNATGKDKYPFSARNLFYQVRPLFRHYVSEDEELDYNYFSPALLDEYVAHNGPMPGLYYDPRGVLYEPHTGKPVHIGTREVETYQFPNWLYNKILYIEKKGLWPILEAAKLAEKYDMAVIASEGYATKAVRHLFENAYKNQGYQLFVLHDADPDGYNICRTLGEATRCPNIK